MGNVEVPASLRPVTVHQAPTANLRMPSIVGLDVVNFPFGHS